ncbi:MAG: hypothetical protein ACYC7F_03865 [Gemmatimonadaceae bacterium]
MLLDTNVIFSLVEKALGARRARAQGVVTRDAAGCRHAQLPVYSPGEFLVALRERQRCGLRRPTFAAVT